MGWEGKTERQRMEELADPGPHGTWDHEWGWYQEDVPTLLAEIDRLRAILGLPQYDGESAGRKKLLPSSRRSALGAVGKGDIGGEDAAHPLVGGMPAGTDDLPLSHDHGPSVREAKTSDIDGTGDDA